MFEININRVKNVLDVKAKGFLSMEEAMKFVEDYNRKVKMIKPEEYTLIIDTRDLKPGSPEVAENMKNVMDMYLNVPFKNRYAYKLRNIVAQMQVQRIGRTKKGFNQIKFINDETEIQ